MARSECSRIGDDIFKKAINLSQQKIYGIWNHEGFWALLKAMSIKLTQPGRSRTAVRLIPMMDIPRFLKSDAH